MNNMPLISVIIPTYNRGKYLQITLDSFISQSYPGDRFEIIIANNNCTDNTQEIIDDYCSKFTNVRSLFEARQGVHYARNSAAKIAKGDILYFTDDDMIADKLLLNEIVHIFELDSEIGVATGKVLAKFDTEPPRWVKKYLINGSLSLTDRNRVEDLIVSPDDFGVYSCHQAIRRNVFFESGGFNPENTAGIWIGDGETGLNIKIKKLGYKFGYSSKSVIYHMIPESRTNFRYLLKRASNQGYCNAYGEYRKHRSRKMILPNLIRRNTIGFLQRMAITLEMIAMRKQSWHFIPAQIMRLYKWNIYDMKLLFNANFRKIVEIDDWINNDPKIKF